MKVDQVERVEPLGTDPEGPVTGTHPIIAVADTAGVSGIGCSAVSRGSVVGTHPVSSAAEGGNTIVEAAKTLGNRS